MKRTDHRTILINTLLFFICNIFILIAEGE